MSVERLTSPAYEPVSLVEARRWLRLEDSDTANTPVLNILIKAMREDAENLTHRAFISRQYRLNLESYPSSNRYGWCIELPFPPLISVDSVKTIDTDGALQTMSTTLYEVHDEAEPAFIIPKYQQVWPVTRLRPDAVQVTFTAGYASGSPTDEAAAQEVLPANLRLWMQSKLATLFEQREQLIIGTIVAKVPRDYADALLDPLIVGTRMF